MALAAVDVDFIEPDEFNRNVKRNIRTLLALKGTTAKAVAPALRMSPTKFSQRMSGDSRWLAVELAHLARVLGVTVDVLTAQSEEEFRKGLTTIGYRCMSPLHSVSDGDDQQMWLMDRTLEVPDPPVLATV